MYYCQVLSRKNRESGTGLIHSFNIDRKGSKGNPHAKEGSLLEASVKKWTRLIKCKKRSWKIFWGSRGLSFSKAGVALIWGRNKDVSYKKRNKRMLERKVRMGLYFLTKIKTVKQEFIWNLKYIVIQIGNVLKVIKFVNQ